MATGRTPRGTAKDLLLAAADELFRTQGYRATTTKQIASKAGTSEALIFRYFGSKAELFVQATIDPFAAVLAGVGERWFSDDTSDLDDEALVHDYVAGLLQVFTEHRRAMLSLFEVVASDDPGPDGDVIRRAFTKVFERITPATASFIDRPEHRDMDPDIAARIGLLLVSSVAVLFPATYADPAEAAPTAAVGGELERFLHAALMQPKGKARRRTRR